MPKYQIVWINFDIQEPYNSYLATCLHQWISQKTAISCWKVIRNHTSSRNFCFYFLIAQNSLQRGNMSFTDIKPIFLHNSHVDSSSHSFKKRLVKAKCLPELAFLFALPKMIYSKDEKNEKDAAIRKQYHRVHFWLKLLNPVSNQQRFICEDLNIEYVIGWDPNIGILRGRQSNIVLN